MTNFTAVFPVRLFLVRYCWAKFGRQNYWLSTKPWDMFCQQPAGMVFICHSLFHGLREFLFHRNCTSQHYGMALKLNPPGCRHLCGAVKVSMVIQLGGLCSTQHIWWLIKLPYWFQALTMELSITHIWCFTVLSTLVAVASSDQQKLVRTGSVHMANRQYQG